MTEIPTTEPEATGNTAEAAETHLRPADVLLNVILSLLAPMFLLASGGDIMFARLAALETVKAYQARTHAELIVIGQIVAFGLAAMGSLSLSLDDAVAPSMAVRLRGNANACNRSAEQNRRALQALRTEAEVAAQPAPGIDPYEAEVIASVAATQQRVAETTARMQNSQPDVEPAFAPEANLEPMPASVPVPEAPLMAAPLPAPAPVSVAPPRASPAPRPMKVVQPSRQPSSEANAVWAAGMAEVAAEFTASLIHLPPAQRALASRRAAALSSCADYLLTGNTPPRLKPGPLDAMMRPNRP